MLYIANTNNDRGNVITVRNNELSETVVIANDIANHSVIGNPVIALANGINDEFSKLGERKPDLSEQGYRKAAGEVLTGKVRPLWAAAVDSVQAAERDHASLFARVVEATDPAIGAEVRGYLRSVPAADALGIASTSPSLLAAVAAAPAALSGLTDAIHGEAVRLHRVERAKAILLGQRPGDFRSKPSLADPVGGVVNEAALGEAATALVDSIASNLAIIEAARATLGRFLAILSVSSDRQPSEVLAMLGGAAVEA